MSARDHGSALSRLYGSLVQSDSPEQAMLMQRLRHAHKFVFEPSSFSHDRLYAGREFTDQLATLKNLRLPYESCVIQIGPFADENHTEKAVILILQAWHEGKAIRGKLYLVAERCRAAGPTHHITDGTDRDAWLTSSDMNDYAQNGELAS